MLLLVLKGGLHVEHWTVDVSTTDGVVDLTIFVAILDFIFAILLLKEVLMLLVVLLVVQLVLVVLSLQLCILLLTRLVTVEVLSACILSLLRRSLLFFLGLLLLLFSSLDASLQSVDPAGKRISLGLVDLELEDLFVLLGHPELPASHLVRLQRRQVVEEAVGVVEDFDVVWVEPLPGLDVPVMLGEELVLRVEAVEQP